VRWPRASAAAVAAVVVLALGCGGSDESESTPLAPLSAEQLRARLLTVDELPAGYAKSSAPAEESPLEAENPECEKILNADDDEDAVAEVDASFEKDANGPFVIEALGSYRPGVAEKDFDEARAALGDCGRVTVRAPPTTGRLRLSERRVRNFGDETLAYAMVGDVTAQGVTVPITGKFVVVRLGDNTVALMVLGIGTPPDANPETLARAAVQRFRAPPADAR
jgi:hypothetical protein